MLLCACIIQSGNFRAVKGLTSTETIRLIRDGEKGRKGVWRLGERERGKEVELETFILQGSLRLDSFKNLYNNSSSLSS